MHAASLSWQLWALLAALFAALTAILAKLGVGGIDSGLAMVIRTAVILFVFGGILLAGGGAGGLAAIPARGWLFLALSGLATGASWLCYFRALQLGDASRVAPLDKLTRHVDRQGRMLAGLRVRTLGRQERAVYEHLGFEHLRRVAQCDLDLQGVFLDVGERGLEQHCAGNRIGQRCRADLHLLSRLDVRHVVQPHVGPHLQRLRVVHRHHGGRFFWTTFITNPSRAYRREEWLAEDRRSLVEHPPRYVVAFEGIAEGPDSVKMFLELGYHHVKTIAYFTVLERNGEGTP